MRMITASLLLLLLILAMPCLGQGFGNDCTVAGVWYGGDPAVGAKYLLTIVPTRAGQFSVTSQLGFFTNPSRVAKSTAFTGELVPAGAHTYENYSMALINYTTDFPPAAAPSDIRAIHSKVEMTDCNTTVWTTDFYGIYFWNSDKVLFESDPDVPQVPPAPHIVEVYHRMPTKCPKCTTE